MQTQHWANRLEQSAPTPHSKAARSTPAGESVKTIEDRCSLDPFDYEVEETIFLDVFARVVAQTTHQPINQSINQPTNQTYRYIIHDCFNDMFLYWVLPHIWVSASRLSGLVRRLRCSSRHRAARTIYQPISILAMCPADFGHGPGPRSKCPNHQSPRSNLYAARTYVGIEVSPPWGVNEGRCG